MTSGSVEKGHSFLENKVYFIVVVIFSLFYFLDVFIGMFMIHNEYILLGAHSYDLAEQGYRMKDRVYDMIEVALLGLMVIENVVKLAFTTRQTRKVRVSFNFILHIS